MKSFLLVVGCTIVAWVAIHYFMRMQPPESSSVPLVAEVMVNPGRNSDTTRLMQSQSSPLSPKSSKQPKSNTTERGVPAHSSSARRVTSPKTTFFKTAVNSDGSFSRVTIYNTQIGNLTIQLLDASRHNGIVFIRRGIKDKHVWEVKIADGELTVYWDDKLVPPG